MSLRRQTTRIVPPLLRERTFRRYWTGQTISLFGDQVSILALPLTAVLVLHAGAAQTGYLTAAGLAPSLLFSIVAGGWVDRKGHRRRVMLTADLVRAVLLASLPITYLAGVLTFAQLYAVAFLVGCASVLFNVAQGTVFASLVRPTDYVAANSLIHGSRALSFVGGQSAGGVLVQLVTAPGAILIDACSFLASALFLRSIHPREPLTAAGGRGHLLEGVRFIAHSREVRALLLATATINVFNFMEAAIFVLYAIRSLGLTPAQLGLVLGIGAVGAVIGAALTSRVARRLGVGGAFTLSCVVFPASFILIPVAGGMGKPAILALLFAAAFGGGVGVVMLDITIGAILTAAVPAVLRARVSGAYSTINYGLRPVGALAGGAMGSALGLRPTLWIATIAGVAGVVWLIPSPIPRLRTLPELRDEPVPPGRDVVAGAQVDGTKSGPTSS
ncbi:MAG: MFS transporter [Candidatus Dormibacteraeota bacterium]|uniref:MFS transporter n=1 Tax=Candidatus Aeolococcus gillhamiae TaxID=3127015 RepID=A0A934K430_9BACT|nr:MFS transporter [Candidatus Dormibacteraeota bacterium]